MDTFVSRKRRRLSTKNEDEKSTTLHIDNSPQEEQTTDEKLAILSSVFENRSQEDLLEALLTNDGSVDGALNALLVDTSSIALPPQQKPPRTLVHGIQSSLKFTRKTSKPDNADVSPQKPIPGPLTRKGKTLYLYDPDDIASNTPCSIIHNFLPPNLANDLLRELLPETTSYTSATFRLFDNVVKSPHTASFYVNDLTTAQAQKSEYLYNGSTLSDVRETLPVMRQVSTLVEAAVNNQVQKRIASHYPHGKKLEFMPKDPWKPNAAFVNCYDGAQQSVGYHTDQLSYLGPHPVIGSLSLGVQREFRIRRIVPPPDLEGLDADSAEAKRMRAEAADAQGQISLPLPHNSLLVMHAEMQEMWKHAIAPASSAMGGITPHPIAGNKRVNITYRWYREEFSPKYTPKCRCGVPCVLKSVMRRKETLGKYVWMCQTAGRVDQGNGEGGKGENISGKLKEEMGKSCGYFDWAEFNEDGVPLWLSKEREKERAAKGGSGKKSEALSRTATTEKSSG